MQAIGTYLLSVTAAAMICGLVQKMLTGKGTASAVGKMLCGVFLAVTVLRPVAQLSFGAVEDFTAGLQDQAQAAVQDGKDQFHLSLAAIIKEKTEAYILDEAKKLDVSLQVQVTLSTDPVPVPLSAKLKGRVSPFAKGKLKTLIRDNLGIPEEKQIWT